jgi:hypothetical protein
MADTKSIEDVEKDLIAVSQEIGDIHECNGLYSYGLARLVWELGKPVEEFTIKELILLHQQYSEKFNHIYALVEEVKA